VLFSFLPVGFQVLLQLVSSGKGPRTLSAMQWLGVDEDMVLELKLFGESLAALIAVIIDIFVEFMLL
jgi:hypothetical protein